MLAERRSAGVVAGHRWANSHTEAPRRRIAISANKRVRVDREARGRVTPVTLVGNEFTGRCGHVSWRQKHNRGKAVRLKLDLRVSCLPVIDKKGKLVGIVT